MERNNIGRKIALVFLLSMVFLFAASRVLANNPATRNFSIQIAPHFKDQPLVLSTKKYVSDQGDTVQIDRFRFYISAVQLFFENGMLYEDMESYYLIDAEDENSLKIDLKDIPNEKLSFIQFRIGVDSTKCMSGAFGGDLDPSNGMYWAWNSGYIHAKLEGTSSSCKTYQNAFEFHVGGFSFPNNAVRTISIPVHADLNSLILAADAHCWMKDLKLAVTNSVVIPGEQAMKVADSYTSMFRMISE